MDEGIGEHHEMKVGAAIILNKVRDGIKNAKKIEQQTGIPKDELMAYIDHLETEGLISIDRSRHLHGLAIMPRGLNPQV